MSKIVKITYTNWRGETAERTIEPESIWYGSTQWHPDEQWFLKAVDMAKNESRDFALKDIAGFREEGEVAIPELRQPQTSIAPDTVKLFADGGSRGNPGPSASGFVLLDKNDQVIHEEGVYLGITTNNQAEYQALKFGLIQAKKMGVREVAVYMDSLLVVNQMKGIFKVKNRDLWPIHESIKEVATSFAKITYTHVPREKNKLADAEVNKTLDAEASK